MWKKLDPKKLDDPNVQKEIGIRLARLKSAWEKCNQFSQSASDKPKDLAKLTEARKEFEVADKEYNDLRETLFK